MSTVASRTFRSTPHRSAPQTWAAIVNLLTQAQDSTAKKELEAVAGIAVSCIADQAPENAPIIVTCDGPRTRIYCIYDDDAIDESNAVEGTIGFDPLMGSWSVSLPCTTDDLQWVHSLPLKSKALESLPVILIRGYQTIATVHLALIH